MSTQSQALNTGQQAIINTDLSKMFLGDNRYQRNSYINNSSYDPIPLLEGTLMGRIHASGVYVPFNAAASDGSQFPVGVLAHDISVAGGATVLATIVDMGDVEQSKIIFFTPNQGLETVVSSRRVKDHIAAQGIKLISSDEMTQYDNQ